MSSLMVPLGSQLVTTTNATLGIAVPPGQIWRVRAVNIQQPAGSAAKNIALAFGTTATAANVKRRYPLLSGLQTAQDFPDLIMVATDQVNVITDAGTNEAVISVTVIKELIS
jgi:hypothetical protein